jgi:hypothetical protein
MEANTNVAKAICERRGAGPTTNCRFPHCECKDEVGRMTLATLSAIHFAEMQAVVEAARHLSGGYEYMNSENWNALKGAMEALDARLKPTPPETP